eukprot:4023029-Alexandrium_andersonii.AAC.1
MHRLANGPLRQQVCVLRHQVGMHVTNSQHKRNTRSVGACWQPSMQKIGSAPERQTFADSTVCRPWPKPHSSVHLANM